MPTDDDDLTIWTVYDRPRDHPDSFIAREWRILPGGAAPVPTQRTLSSRDVDEIRQQLADLGAVRLDRSPGDDPTIVESWI